MTIGSHLPLRKQMMDNYIHKMIRVNRDTFKATVDPAIIICERNKFPKEDGEIIPEFNEDHVCQMVDMTNISIHQQYGRFIELMHKTEGVRFGNDNDQRQNVSTPEYAIYYYPQTLIQTNSNLPFFVASPKLFTLMNDGNDRDRKPKTESRQFDGEDVTVRKISFNDQVMELIKLGDVADVKQGLATGDNDAYLFQDPEAWGTYRNIYEYEEYLLTEDDLERIQQNDDLRLEVIEKGITKEDTSSDRYFGGRYIVPYDKGGKSDAEGGWMPNYNVETSYFIDWSEWAVNRLKTLTTKERNRQQGKSGGSDKLCSRFQNKQYYFLNGIDYSPTGEYSPTFRKNSDAIFCHKASSIFIDIDDELFDNSYLLPFLNSKPFRFFLKAYIAHTVETPEGKLKDSYIIIDDSLKRLKELKEQIFEKQKEDPYYDYASHEQIGIDKLVYEAFGLSQDEIREIENWYERKYTNLIPAQKENLRKLGKSDDYLELYGYEELEEA